MNELATREKRPQVTEVYSSFFRGLKEEAQRQGFLDASKPQEASRRSRGRQGIGMLERAIHERHIYQSVMTLKEMESG